MTLRSGTNDIHGSLFHFHRNENVQARQVFASTKAPVVYNQFGFTLGGPVVKNRIFFFGDYQGSRDRLGTVTQPAIPTLPFRRGDFSGETERIYDPATGDARGAGRTQFANNMVPQSRISPISQAIMGFIPDPTRPGGAGSSNFERSIVREKDIDAFDIKGDFVATANDRFSLRYSRQQAEVVDCGLYGPDCGIYGGPRNGGFAGFGPATTQSPSLTYSRVFSPTFVMESRFGMVRNRNDAINSDTGLRTSEEIGIPGVNVNEWTSGLSDIRVAGFGSPMVGFSPSLPWVRSVTFFGWQNNFTKTTGNHVTRFGFEMRRERNDLLQTQTFNPRGRFEFAQGQTGALEDTRRGIANAFASFLLDRPNLAGRDLDVQFPTRRELIWAMYVQDKWQVTNKLTMDLGMRFEIENASNPRFAGGYSNYNFLDNTLELNGLGGRPFNNGVRSDYSGWSPRFGLAYRINEKTVFRGGYGISQMNRRMGQQNFPVKQNNAFPADNAFVPTRTMAEGFPAFEAVRIPDNGIINLNDPEFAPFAGQNFGNIPLDLKRPYVQSWNISLQRSLAANFVLDVAYVGNHGVNNQTGWNVNAGRVPGRGNAGRLFQPIFGRVANTNTFIGTHTYYNSLQVKVNRRFTNGLGITTAYTWGKSLGFNNDLGGLNVHIPEFFMSNKGRSNDDRRHIYTQSYQYELPFGKNKRWLQSGAGKWILGGWELQGVFTAQSGGAFTPVAAAGTLNAPGNGQRANVVGTPRRIGDIAGPAGDGLWFTTDAFAIPAQNTLGNAGWNILSGPGFVNLDASIFRRFALPVLGEQGDLTLRIESFNATNTPHFNNPVNNVNDINFGRVRSAQDDPRQYQFALTVRF